MNIVDVKILKMYDDVIIPEQATIGSAAFDIRARLDNFSDNGLKCESIVINPMQRIKISTGIKLDIDKNICLEILQYRVKNNLFLIGRHLFLKDDEVCLFIENNSNEKFIIKQNDIIGSFISIPIELKRINNGN